MTVKKDINKQRPIEALVTCAASKELPEPIARATKAVVPAMMAINKAWKTQKIL